MPVPTEYSFIRYLAAKQSVDDRALNRHVWHSLMGTLPAGVAGTSLRILEIGAGIGTMIERWLAWGPPADVHYTALDADVDNIAEAQRRLPERAAASGWHTQPHTDGELLLLRGGQTVVVRPVVADVFECAVQAINGRPPGGHGEVPVSSGGDVAVCSDSPACCLRGSQESRTYDLMIAHAFLDLVDTQAALSALLPLLTPGGLLYATLVFDGATILQPELQPELDATVEQLYHGTMDGRLNDRGEPSGDSHSGRHLFGHLKAAGATILCAGSSDWVVFGDNGNYPEDEAYFLHFIVNTLAGALRGHPALESESFTEWIKGRHAQIERGDLVYVAHQLDVLARAPADGSPACAARG
jgi:hypothetical protein